MAQNDDDSVPKTRAPAAPAAVAIPATVARGAAAAPAGTDATMAAPAAAAAGTDATMAAGSVPAAGGGPATADQLPVVETKHYVILSEFARGGLGRILRAKDLRTGRPVAIKEMLHGTPDAAARFVREALVTANLQHPAIVPVYEVGRWPEGEPFYAMKFVVGKSLEDVVIAAKDHRSRMALLPHVIATAEALAYAHGERIIHRDLKPANVLTGAYGETVVVDWGLAKRIGEPDDAAPAVSPISTTSGRAAAASPASGAQSSASSAAATGGATVAGSVMGTPMYMPPEQAAGEPCDERADVYAIGAMLYQVLCGLAPYIEGRTADQILSFVLTRPPRPLTELAPEAPADLLAIVAKAMARSPDDRYPTAKELADDLTRFQTGQLVSAHEYSWREVVWRWVKKNRAAVTVAVVLLAALVAGGIMSVRRIVRARDTARAEEREATRQRHVADDAQLAARGKLAELFAEQGRQELLAGQPARAMVYLNQAYQLGRDDADLRFLMARAAPALDLPPAASEGHDQAVVAAELSPDGTRVVTASWDNTARVWDAATGRRLATLTGHRNKVVWATFSPDGAKVATASADGTAALWDAASGKQLFALTGHSGPVRRVVWSPDGTRVATAADDNTARVWDVATGAEIRVLAHQAVVTTVAWDRSGARLITASGDNLARVWDAATGALLVTLTGHTRAVFAAAFSPDGHRIVTGAQDKTVRLWDAASGKQTAQMEHGDWVFTAAFSEDGGRVVSSSYDRTARVWDAATGKRIASLEGHTAYVRSAVFSPDGNFVVTSSDDRTARLWDARSGRIVGVFVGHTDTVQSALFSRDGARVVTAADDYTARVWDVKTGQVLARCDGQATGEEAARRKRLAAGLQLDLTGHAAGMTWGEYSPDQTRIVTSGYDGVPHLWDAKTGALQAELHGHTSLNRITWSPDGTKLVSSGSGDHTARIWDARTATALLVLQHDGDVQTAAWSKDGTQVLTAGGAGVLLWDAVTGKLVRKFEGPVGPVTHAEFSRDGGRVAASGTDDTARVWETATGKQLATMKGQHTTLSLNQGAVHFSPDGTRLVTYSREDTARLWDAASGALIASMKQTDDLWCGDWSPDGERIVTCSSDKTAKLWDGHTGKLVASLDGHTFWVTFAVYSPDAKLVVTTGEDGTVKAWSVATGKLLFSYDLHTDWVGEATISPDGQHLISVGGDKTAKVWDLSYEQRSPAEIAKLVEERAPWTLDDSRLIPRAR